MMKLCDTVNARLRMPETAANTFTGQLAEGLIACSWCNPLLMASALIVTTRRGFRGPQCIQTGKALLLPLTGTGLIMRLMAS